ncbi:indole-diterpene biosynthesis protein-like protein PaxU [Trematosphaeria pertusa]|uniref:Indole-diterpene biosynthesis protein-like protein PaxU n=1 Tax=Trematosphaeria pertusa TaxID=390896 RepID=A0A6A6HY73_9PLEO|nr:indole-diterpene biosynthesis protein-like protein PaxU [Trematosphaeria pertusa]KAF2243165.1 indole-diterpene biosynthesis protein-like protein PaxU [Trematosphaeria pertusa]
MAAANPEASEPFFTKLGPRIALHTPPNHAAGQLVIIATWLGAARKHITKYLLSYRSIAPRSKILLIESDVSILTSSYPSQRKAIKSAVHAVRAVLDECGYSKNDQSTNPPKILLHTFSNGGTNSATQMLIALGEQFSSPLPLLGIIYDSGPAKGEYWKSYNSMMLSLPRGMARTVGPAIVHFILVVLFTSVAAGRYDKPEDLFRRTLLDEKLVKGHAKKEGRICYLFSKADDHVDWKDVVDHAEVARDKGWEVEEALFEDTPHCNHFTKNTQRYTDMMHRLWHGSSNNTDEPRSML